MVRCGIEFSQGDLFAMTSCVVSVPGCVSMSDSVWRVDWRVRVIHSDARHQPAKTVV